MRIGKRLRGALLSIRLGKTGVDLYLRKGAEFLNPELRVNRRRVRIKSPWHVVCLQESMFSPQASALLRAIHDEIQRYGQSIVRCEKLLVLVSKSDPIGVQFGHIFATAEREHWSVNFGMTA